MKITGTYVIKSNDKIIGEFTNMLTTNGLLFINQYLTGQIKYWADSIAIGALSSSSTTASTTTLQYESYRYPVLFKTYQSGSSINQIILKATVDPSAEFEAYEIGVFPTKVDTTTFADHYSITGFSELTSGSSNWYINGIPATNSLISSRVGSSNINLSITTSSATNTASIANLLIDSSRYTENDNVNILYYTSASFSSASVTVKFGDSSTPQVFWSGSTVIGSTPSGSFYSASVDMGTKDTNFIDPVTSAFVTFDGASGSVQLDHMKFVLGDSLIPDLQLISRSISTAPNTPLFSKVYAQPMDIEYYLRVT